jgi:hypothetical protein
LIDEEHKLFIGSGNLVEMWDLNKDQHLSTFGANQHNGAIKCMAVYERTLFTGGE